MPCQWEKPKESGRQKEASSVLNEARFGDPFTPSRNHVTVEDSNEGQIVPLRSHMASQLNSQEPCSTGSSPCRDGLGGIRLEGSQGSAGALCRL